MINNLNIWARTLLISYKYLEQLCNTIDRMVEKQATSSYYNFGNYVQNSDILIVSKRLYKLMNKKVDYINIKVIVDKALKEMPKRKAKYLILRHIQNMSIPDIANVFNISERTFFRKFNSVLDEFSNVLQKIGYTAERLDAMFANDYFIDSIYTSVQKDVRYLIGAKNPIEDFDFEMCVDMVMNKSLTKIVI